MLRAAAGRRLSQSELVSPAFVVVALARKPKSKNIGIPSVRKGGRLQSSGPGARGVGHRLGCFPRRLSHHPFYFLKRKTEKQVSGREFPVFAISSTEVVEGGAIW